VTAKILIADDDAGMRKGLGGILRRAGYLVTEVPGGTEAADQLARDVFDVVITDLKMEPLSGLDVLRLVKQMNPDLEVILMTAFGTIEAAVEAMKLGAFDFITKPFQKEEILLRVRNALDKRRLKEEVHFLRTEARNTFGFEGIVGQSEKIRQVLSVLPRVAQTESTVLITGESGSGKELIAKAIHGASRRAHGPFVSVSCAALPEQLLENELFGHVKGAFTGALAARKGLLEEAHGGTFFLDEIGEAPVAIQAKLLRVLEDRTIRRLGDNRSIPVDVRITAATNRDLQEAVREKSFREDLFYRLNVITIHLPPLRERKEDIPLLARHFLALHCQRLQRDLSGFSPAALKILTSQEYPGNIRELSNVVEQAVALAVGPMIEPHDLPEKLRTRETDEVPSPVARLAAAEREVILELLQTRGGNLGMVAQDLGISRTTLWRRIKEHKIETRGSWGDDISKMK
jgi:two-component system response regulator HydG